MIGPRPETELARAAGFAVAARRSSRRSLSWLTGDVLRRGRAAVASSWDERPMFWRVSLGVGLALVVAALAAARLIDPPLDTTPIAMGETARPKPKKVDYPPAVYAEQISAGGYANKDLGLTVPAPQGWLIEQAARADLPGAQYEGALVTLRHRTEDGHGGTLISVVRNSGRADALGVLNGRISSSPGRRIVEEPELRTLGGKKCGRALYAAGAIVAHQYAFSRESDVILVTAMVPSDQFSKELTGQIDALVGAIKLDGVN